MQYLNNFKISFSVNTVLKGLCWQKIKFWWYRFWECKRKGKCQWTLTFTINVEYPLEEFTYFNQFYFLFGIIRHSLICEFESRYFIFLWQKNEYYFGSSDNTDYHFTTDISVVQLYICLYFYNKGFNLL